MPSKWIEIDSPETPTTIVAAAAIRLRLQYVQEVLPLAAYESRDDIEYVHQLRVGCRRTDATLKAFGPILGSKSDSLRKWLRQVRRSAGPARDLDVLIERFQKGEDTPEHAYLIARLEQLRSDSQHALVEVATKTKPKKINRHLASLLQYLEEENPKSSIPIKKFAKKSLRKASKPFLRQASIKQPSLEQLHQLRIAGKRLRYSIEIFHGALHPSTRTQLYPLVEELQSLLGQLNDFATAQTLFQSLLTDMPADDLAAYLARCVFEQYEAAQKLREEFLRSWTAKRIAKLESHLQKYT